MKAQQAQVRGAKGLIIYSTPPTMASPRPGLPRRPVAARRRIQRGSIQYIFNYPGDPLTPGVPSAPGTRRLRRPGRQPAEDPDHADLLWRGAAAAGGAHGPGGAGVLQGRAADHLPRRPGRHAGPAGSRHRLRADAGSNVIATIRGITKPDEKVVIGAHYDGWTYGTSDNTSGWTAIMEVGRSLGRLLDRGWRPERTIVLAGWDGESACSARPSGSRSSRRTCGATPSPTPTSTVRAAPSSAPPGCRSSTTPSSRRRRRCGPEDGRSVFDTWTDGGAEQPEIGRLGSGSDYTSFLDHLGVPSFEAGFTNPASSGTYHSAYDDP